MFNNAAKTKQGYYFPGQQNDPIKWTSSALRKLLGPTLSSFSRKMVLVAYAYYYTKFTRKHLF